MLLRRGAASGILEAVRHFRRLKGYSDMPMLVSALRPRDRPLRLLAAGEAR